MFKHSESLSKLAPALAKAQKNFAAALKDSKNPFFKSNYADLGSVIDACYPALNDNEISLLQPVVATEHGPVVVTTLLHSSGEWIAGSQPVITAKQNDPQSFGAAVTYARRFALSAMVGMKTADDDGESLAGRSHSVPAPAQSVAIPTPGSTKAFSKPAPTLPPLEALKEKADQAVAKLAPISTEASLPWDSSAPVEVKAEPAAKKKSPFAAKKAADSDEL